jgi:hypothetical protein
LAVPVLDGNQMIGVIALYAGEEFQRDHSRMLESAAQLFSQGAHRSSSPAVALERRDESRGDRQVH